MRDKAGAVVESRISLGVYPVITVAQARKARDDAKAKRSSGIDPVQARKLEKLQAKALRGETFADMGREYIELRTPEWGDRHKDRSVAILERDLLPKLGPRIMRDITTPELFTRQ